MGKGRLSNPTEMKKGIRASLSALCFAVVFAAAAAQAEGVKFDLELSTGYRVDQFDWSIAGPILGRNVNVLSELTWEDLEIFQVKAAARVTVHEAFYLRGSLAGGQIFDGTNVDSDFRGPNRTSEFSRSVNVTADGQIWDATAGVGYILALSEKLRLIPLIGYSYNRQELTLSNGVQTVSLPPSAQPVGPFPGLDSVYDAEWWGPWIGVDAFYGVSDRIRLSFSFEYHWADYEAVADWNLRTDLLRSRSFEHDAEGQGFVASLGAEYLLTGPWSLLLNLSYQQMSTDPGIDRVFFADGTLVVTPLNEVNWKSFAIFAGVTYRFGW